MRITTAALKIRLYGVDQFKALAELRFEEELDNTLVLFIEYGTCGECQQPPYGDMVRTAFQHVVPYAGKNGNIFRGEFPPDFRMASEGSEPRARCIYEDRIELPGSDCFVKMLRIGYECLVETHLEISRTLLEQIDLELVVIDGDEGHLHPPSAHGVALQEDGFRAASRTDLKERFGHRFRQSECGDALRRFIADKHAACLEGFRKRAGCNGGGMDELMAPLDGIARTHRGRVSVEFRKGLSKLALFLAGVFGYEDGGILVRGFHEFSCPSFIEVRDEPLCQPQGESLASRKGLDVGFRISERETPCRIGDFAKNGIRQTCSLRRYAAYELYALIDSGVILLVEEDELIRADAKGVANIGLDVIGASKARVDDFVQRS